MSAGRCLQRLLHRLLLLPLRHVSNEEGVKSDEGSGTVSLTQTLADKLKVSVQPELKWKQNREMNTVFYHE